MVGNPRLLLDTHTWIWGSTEIDGFEKLSSKRRELLNEAAASGCLYASDASVWELALKQAHGELLAIGDLLAFLDRQSRYAGVQILPLSADVIIASTALPLWKHRDGREHRDPADRFLVATARKHGLTLVTADEEILAYGKQGHVRTLDPTR